MDRTTLDKLSIEFANLIYPLRAGLSDIEQAKILINTLGWELPSGINDVGLTVININQVVDKLNVVLNSTPVEKENLILMASRYTDLLAAIGNLLSRVQIAVRAISGLAGISPDYLNKTKIHEKLFIKLLDFLIIKYMQYNHYSLFTFLEFVGIFSVCHKDADPSNYQTEHIEHKIYYGRIGLIFSNPLSLPQEVYGWGTNNLNQESLLTNLARFIIAFGGEARLRKLPRRVEEKLIGHLVPEADTEPMPQVVVSLIKGLGWDPLDIGVSMFGLRKTTATATDAGIGFCPFIRGSTELNFPITDHLFFEISSSFNVEGGLLLSLLPNQNMQIYSNLFNESTGGWSATGELELKFMFKKDGEEKVTLLTLPGGSDLTASSVFIGAGAGLMAANTYDFFMEAGLNGGVFALKLDNSDGFLTKILPADGLKANFDAIIGWSKQQGVYFKGSGGLEIKLPVHISLGPIEISNIYLNLGISGGKLPLEVSGSIAAKLGPLSAVVERLGVKAVLDFPSNQAGNLGPVDLVLQFKPPNGVGLAIDTGAVKGGGYLFFDHDREEYAGTLELVFSEWINLKAIGLITTKMPDGSKGFSLLVIITAEFGSGIQLGYGFTLLGVGGLLGLSRTVMIEALKEGIRTGAVESVMFPQNVVANAPRIISDLKKFFPVKADIFLIGPMAKIGWSTPPLVSLSLGVIIEFPNVTITILGVLKAILPHEKADILRLQVNFIGRVEPSNKLLWFYAELFDSRVLFITLQGGMGLLVNWGDNANFVLSVGGFHPRYSPPPLPFPEPPRIAANILNTSWAKIRIEGYFAVTSNSVQFGARAELYFGLSAFRLEGHLGFDALFQFNPFFFSFGLSFSLSVKVFGIGLWSVGFSGLLEGPTPWHIKGKGKISLLFFSIKVPFEHTWGERRETQLDPIPVFPLLEAELNALTNWKAVLPASSNILVSLRKLGDTDTDQLVLHPVGKLHISQRRVPIDFKLDKVGNQLPSDVNRLFVDAAIPGGGSLSVAKTEEKFAIGQYKNLSDSDRLSSPAFEPLPSGIEIAVAGEQLKTDQAVKRIIRYETIIIDNNFKRHVKSFFLYFKAGFSTLNNLLFGHFLLGSAVSKSVLSQHHKKRMQPFEDVIQIQPSLYSVAFNTNNRPIEAAAVAFTSQAKATEYMQQQILRDPNLASDLHVIPNTEVNLAA